MTPTVAITSADLAACLVDADWYRATYYDIAGSGTDPAHHYLRFGWLERRNPNRWFDTGWCLDRQPELRASAVSPLENFLQQQQDTNAWAKADFNLRRFVCQHFSTVPITPEKLAALILPGFHGRLDWEQMEAVSPHLARTLNEFDQNAVTRFLQLTSLIDPESYGLPDVDVVEHYFLYGWREGKNPNPWFQTAWYLAQHLSAANSGRPPIEDYLDSAEDGINPHPGFDVRWYRRRYLPEGSTCKQAYLHFLHTGAREGAVPNARLDNAAVAEKLAALPPNKRSAELLALQADLASEPELIQALIDSRWYYEQNPDVQPSGLGAVSHYLQYGWREARDPNPWFSSTWYLSQHPDARQSQVCPLLHFIRTGAAMDAQPCKEFDVSWYARQFLGAHSPSVDAFARFLTEGISSGHVPNRLLHRPDILEQVAATPAPGRTALLQSLSRLTLAQQKLTRALVDRDWYRRTYSVELPDAAQDYLDHGWRAGREPNAWFQSTTYWEAQPGGPSGDLSALEHYVRQGSAFAGRPHAFFNIEWYASRYSNGARPSAEALLHFMTIGRKTGTVPDPRLETKQISQKLLTLSADEQTVLLKRLLDTLARVPPHQTLTPENADLWPLLLTLSAPENTLPVLLLVPEQSASLPAYAIEAAALALPPEESKIYGLVDSGRTLRLSASLNSGEPSVTLQLPRQAEDLKAILQALPCRRAAVLDETLFDTPAVRAVRNAGLPVFRNAARELQYDGKDVPVPSAS